MAESESEFDFNPSKQHVLDTARKQQRSLQSRILFWFLALMAATAVAVLFAALVFSGRWTDYKSAAGKFSARFPEPPAEKNCLPRTRRSAWIGATRPSPSRIAIYLVPPRRPLT
jgi:hypothetical protein